MSRLGKGLTALFADNTTFSEEIQENETIVEIKLGELKRNPYQPRTKFDDEKIDELANSIVEHGVLQPIIVTPVKEGKGYYIVAGERRFRACQKLGKETIPAIVRNIDSQTMAEIALLENLQRENLTIVEEALAYNTLMEKYHLTHLDIARRTGKSRSHITNVTRILKLPEIVLNMLNEKEIEFGHAKILVGLDDKQLIVDLAEKIKEEGLSVRELEQILKNVEEKLNQKVNKKEPKINEKNPNIRELEKKLIEVFGTKTEIISKNKGGKLIINYENDEDFNRILKIMNLENILD